MSSYLSVDVSVVKEGREGATYGEMLWLLLIRISVIAHSPFETMSGRHNSQLSLALLLQTQQTDLLLCLSPDLVV